MGNVFTDHRNLRMLSFDECLERLAGSVVGRLAFIDHGEPVVLPIAFGLDGSTVVFRTSWGSKLQMATSDGPVAVEVDEFDPVRGTGWSVLVKGTAAVEYAAELTRRWDKLEVPYWLDTSVESFWVRVTAEEISGREVAQP